MTAAGSVSSRPARQRPAPPRRPQPACAGRGPVGGFRHRRHDQAFAGARRRELLLNTFLRRSPPRPTYRALPRTRRHGVDPFHYVSASPLQLLPALEVSCGQGFPSGSLHLRETTSLARLWRAIRAATSRRRSKPCCATSRNAASCWSAIPAKPTRRSCRSRPRASRTGRRHRDPRGRRATADAERYRRTFAGLAPALWQVFTDAADWRTDRHDAR